MKSGRGYRTCKVCDKQVPWHQVKTYKGKTTCTDCIKNDQSTISKQYPSTAQ